MEKKIWFSDCRVCFHGTLEKNVQPIIEKGLLVPDGKTVVHSTDTGYWGKGIYVSPNPGLSVGYCRGGKSLFICSVVMGKKFKCTQMINGQPLKPGYDSHEDPR